MNDYKKIAIKGFDKDLKCRDHQYKVGEVYEQPEKPKLCEKGFHFCQTYKDVLSFYPEKNGNRYCVIEVLGDVDYGVDKSCTNKIKIIKEITKTDIIDKISYEELAEMCEYGFIIGGSTSLKMQGYNIDRPTSDVDLVIEKNVYDKVKDDIFIGYKNIPRFSGMDSIKCYEGIFGQKYDILIGDTKNYVTRNFQGYQIKLQDSDIIWNYKLKYALRGSIKHMNDIKKNGIEFMIAPKAKYPKKKFDLTQELPF